MRLLPMPAPCSAAAMPVGGAALPDTRHRAAVAVAMPCGRRRHRSRHPARIALRLSAWLALLGAAAQAQAQCGAERDGLCVRGQGGDWRHAVALETHVDVRVRGLIVETVVVQRYRNDSGEWLEGRYLLPLPGDGAVGQLRLHVGDRVIEGEVQEKEAAQAAYQAAAAAGQVASLVEQARPNRFRTAVANIGPGDDVEIEIGYWQAARWQDGAFSLTVPLTFVPPFHGGDGLPGADLDEVLQPVAASAAAIDLGEAFEPTVSLAVDLEAGLPLAAIDSPSHAIHVEAIGDGHRVRLGEWVDNADRDFLLRWQPVASAQPQRIAFTESIAGEHYALVMLVPPTLPVAPVPRELIVVVDNSGSMQGEAMQQAKAAVDRALARLRPGERFNVVRFDDSTETVFPQAVAVDPASIATARAFVGRLSADGGTDLYPALELAFAGATTPGFLRQVVLITDAGIGNEQQLLQQIETRRGDARLFAVGIGSAPNEHFLRRAVELGRGAYTLVRDLGEVERGTDALLAKLDQPALRDLQLQWPVAAEVYPERLPDLYVGEPLQIVARLPALAGELAISGRSRDRAWHDRLPLVTAQAADGRGVARLWARAKITALDDALRAGADAESIRAQTLTVALQHQLVSRYTSLVAVDRTPARPAGSDLASAGFANAVPAGGDALAYAQGSTPARQRLAIAVALALLALLAFGRRAPASTPRPGHDRRHFPVQEG